ncbi:MAG: pyridoxal-phosphate dependent enzyme, partial [Candidatus Omnitrophica bacterium]|nr:pyridoxal-phosphate dependent enzyme [Candidatus Omnitrophota bacterium]
MKEAKYKTQLSAWHRSIALFVAISFLACDTLTYAQSVHSPQSTNHSEASLQNRGPWTVDRGQIIPSQLGTVEEEFIASRSTNDERRHTIFFIQDAHDSLEAQENIAKIIYHLVDHQGVKTVFEEGHEGPVPTDEYFGFIRDPKIKEKVSYFLMDKLRLGGAEYAHINRKRQEGRSKKEEGRKFKNLPSSIFSLPSDFRLIGVDSQKLHKQNIRSYRRASRHQKEIGEDLDALRQELGKLAQQHFSREFKDWLKLREKYQDGKIQLMDYVRRAAKMRPQSTVPRRQIPPPKNHGPWTVDRGGNYPILQLLISDRSEALAVLGQIKPEKIFEEIKQLEQITVESFLTSERDREIYQDLELLRLLEKLNQLELSAKEYDFVKLSLQDFKTENLARFLVLETGKSMIFSRRWEGKLKKAAKFYETARAREDAVAVHLKNLLASNPVNRLTGVLDDRYAGSPEKKFILVFGGFHKERIKQILTALGVSYVIITPKISAPSPRHQQYYKTLMTIGQHPFELSLNLRTAAKPVDVMSLRHGRGEVWFIEKVIKRNLFLSPMILNQKIDLEAGKKILAPPLLTTRAEVRKRVAPTLQGGIALGQAILFTPRSELRQTREAWKLWTNDLRTKLEELQGKFKDNRHLFKSDFSETQNLFDAWLAEIPKLVSITNALNEKSVGALDQSARQVLEARLDQEKLDSAGRDSSSIRPNQAREGTYHGLIQVFNGLRRIKKEMIQIIASLKPEPPQTTWDDSEALRLVMHGWKITQQIEELTDKIAKSIPRDLTSPFPLQFFLAPAHSESTPSAHSRFMRRRSEMRVKNKFLLQQIENGIQLEVLQHAPAAAMPNDERVALRADLATQIRKKLADWAKDHETGDLVTILEGDPEVWPDADLLDEILWNAIEFAGLTRAKKGLVRVRLFRKADKVILQVLDQGTGINPFSWKKLGLDRVAHRRTNHAGTGTGIFRNLKDMMRYVPGFRMRVWTRDRGQVKGCLFSRKSMDGRIQRKKWKRVDGAETREQNFKTGFSLIFPCPVSLSREEIEKDNAAAQEEILHESRHWHEIPGTLSQKRSELRIGDPEKIYALHESIYVRDQVKVLKRVTALSEVAQSFWAQIAKDKGAGRNAQESFQKMHDNEALIARGKSPGSRYGSFKDWNERLDATSYLYTGEALLEATILQRIDSGQISSDFLSLSVKAATILHEFFIEKSKGSEGHLEFTFKEYLDFCAKEMLGSSYDHEDLGEEAVLSVPGTLFFNRLLNLALNQFNRMATRNPSDLRSELRALQDKRSLAAKALEQAVSPAETKNPVAKENRSLRAEVRTNFSGPRNLKTGSVGDGSDFGENEPVYQEAKKRYEQWRTEGFRDRKVAALIGLAGDFEKTIENLRRVRFENKAQAPAIFQLKMQLRFATGAVWLVLAEQAQKAENIQEFEKNLSQAWGYLGTVKLALKETGHEDDTEQLLGIHQAEFLPVYARARCRWLQYYWVVYTTLNGKEDPTHRAYAQSFLGAAHFQLEKAKHAVVRAEKWIQAGRGNGTILTSLKDNLQFFEEKFHGVQRQQRYLSHTYLRGVYDLWEGRISREHPYAREILARNWDIPGIAISAYHLGKHPSKSKALVAELFMLDRLGELTKHDTMKVLGFGLHPNSVRGQPRLNIEVDLVAEFYDGNPFGLRGIYLIDFIWKGADQNMVPVNELTDKYQLAAQYMSAQGFPIAGALRIFSGLHIKDVLSPKDLEGRTKTISLATNLSRTGNGNNKLPEVEKVLLWGQSVPNIAQVLHKHVSGRSEVRSTSNRKKPGFSWPQHNDDIVIESPFGKISWKELGWEVLPKAREYIEGVAPASEYEASRPSRLDRLKWRLSTLKKAMKGELSLYKDGSGFKHFVRKNYMWLVQSFGRTDWALSPEDWEIIGDHLMLDLPAVGDDELLASQMPGPTRGIRSEVRNALMRYLLSLGGEETQAQRVIHEVFRGKKYEFPPQAKEAAAWVSAWEKEADAASTLMDTVRDLYFAKTFLTLDSLEYKGIQKRMGEIYIQARQQAYTKIGRAPPSIAKVGIPFEADRPKIPAYLILPATLSPKKRLPVVVLFHGLSGSKEFPQFDSLEEQFIAANIGVLRVDLFGHGENQDRVRTPADFARYADAIATFFKEDSRLDSDRLGAVGFSLGGWVTLQAAIRSPIFQKNLRAAAVINAPVRPFYLDEKQFLKMREHLQAIFQDKNIKHLSSQMNAMALSEDEVRVLLGLPIPLQIFSGEKDLIISADTKFLKKVLGESGVQTVKKQMHYLLPEARDKMFGEITRQTSQAFLDYHRSEARSAKSAGAADAQEGIENGVTAIKKARKQDDLVRFFKLNLSAPLIVYGVLGVTLSAAAVSLGLTLAIAVLFKFFWSPGARFNLPDYWLRRFDLSPNTISFSNSNSSARSELRSKGRRKTQLPAWHSYPSQSVAVLKKELKRARWKKIRAVLKKTNGDWEEAGVRLKIEKRNGYSRSNILAQEVTDLGYWTNAQKYIRRKEKSSARSEMRTKHFSKRVLLLEELSREDRLENIQTAFAPGGLRREKGVTPESIQRAVSLLRKYGITSSQQPWFLESTALNDEISHKLGRDAKHGMRILFLDATQGPTGSFKDFSPIPLYDAADQGTAPKEAWVASTGNQAAAWYEAVRRVNEKKKQTSLIIVMGMDAQAHKKETLVKKGATILDLDPETGRPLKDYEEALELARKKVAENPNEKLLASHADSQVVSGYASIIEAGMDELLRKKKLSAGGKGEGIVLLAPVGSGGFYAGLMEILAKFPKARTFGVSAAPADAMFESIYGGRIIHRSGSSQIVDGTAATPEPFAYDLIRATSDGLLRVSESQALHNTALIQSYFPSKPLEATAGLSLAALFRHKDLFAQANTVIIPLTSKNQSLEIQQKIAKLLQRSEMRKRKDLYPLANERLPRLKQGGARAQVYPQLIHKFQKQNMTHFPEGFIVAKKRPQQVGPRAEISAVSLDWNQELERVWPGEERSDKAIQIRGKRWSVINGREFILAGDYLFVTEEIWKKKQAELESLKNHVIITPLKPKGALSPRPDFISGQHTLLAVLFMQAYQDHIQNQVVLDAGSQQGILLVLASRLGAAKVIGVEKHLQWVHDSEASFVQNSIQNAQMIHADFKDLAQHPAAEEASVWMTSLPENGSEFEPGYLGNRHLDFAAREHIKTYFLFGGRTHIVGTPADFPPEFLKLGWSLQETFTHPSPEYADYLVQVFTRNPGGLLHFPDNRSEMRSHDSLKKIPGLVMLWKNAGTYQLKPGEIWFQIGAYLFLSDKTSASLLQDWLENKHPKPGTRETEAEWQRFILRCRKFALYHDLLSNKMNGAHVYPDSIFVFKAAHERDVFVMRITDSRHPNNMNLEQWEGPYDQRPVAKTLAPYQDVLFDERRDELDAASPRQETPVYAMPLTASPDGKTMSGTMFLFPPPIFQLYADPVVAHDGLYGTVVSYGKILMRPELLSFGDGKTIYLEPRIDGSIATEDLVFPAIYFDWIQSLARTYEGFQMSGLNAGGLDFGGLMHQHQVAVASGKTFDDYWKQHPQELFSLNAPLEFVRSQEFRSQIYQMAVEGFQEFSFGRAPLLKPLRENDSNHYSHGVYEMNLETILPALEQARQLKLRQEIEHGSLRAYLYQGECNWGRENPERWDPHGLDRDFVFHPDALYLDLRTQEGALVFRQELARPSIFLTPLIIHEFGDRFSLSDDWQRLAASTDIPAFPWNPGGLLHFPDNRSELRASRVTLPELSEKGLSITRSEVRSYAGDREGKPALLTFQRAYKQFGHNDFKLEEYLSKYPDKDAATVRGHVMRLESLGILEIKHKEQPVKNHSFSIRVFDAKNLREAEFILSMLETKHDEVPVRSLMERFFKVKKLFFVPSQSLDYSKMESAFRKRDPSFKHANPYITYLLIKKYFYSIFKMSAAFQYVQGISYGGFHIQMDALLEAGLLQSVQIKADPKTTSSKTHWLKLVDLNPHQEKQTLQALKEYSRNPQKDRLKAEVSRILRDGTIPEAPTPAVPVYDVWSLFSSGEPASQPQESAPLTLPAILHAIDQTVKSGKVHPNLKDVGTPLKTNRHILNLFAARNGVRLRDLEVWGSNLPSDDEEFNALMDEKLQRLRTEKNSWALIPIPVEALLEEIHIVAASSLKVRAAAAQGDLAGKGVIFSPRSPEESRDLEAYTERYLASLGLKPDLANKAYVLQEDEKWWRHRGLQSKDHPMDANDRTVLVQAEKEWREALLQRRKSKKDLYDYVKVLLDNAEAGLKTALEQRKPSAIRIARKKLEALNPGHPLIAQSLNQSGTANVEISKVIPDRVVPEPSRPAVPVPEISRGLVPIAKSIAEVLAPVASKNLSVTVPAESTKTKKDEGAIITDADRKRAGQLIHDMSRPPGSKATLSLSQILPDIVSRAKLSGAADDWKVVLIVVERIRKQAKKTDEEYLRSVEAMALEKIIHPRSEIRNPIVDLGVFGLVDDEARHRFLDAIIKDTDALLLHGIAFLSNKSQFSPTKLNPQIVFQTEIFSKAAAEMVAELVWKGDAFHKAGGFHALLVQRGGQNILTVYPEKIPAPFRPQALRQSVRSEVRISNLQELQPAPKEMNIELAVLDWDGTISRIREGWEGIMAPYAAMIVSGGEALTQGEWKEILKGVQNEEAVDPETLMTSVMEKMVDSGRISEDAMKWTIKMIEESKGDPTPLQFERAYKEAVRRGHQTQADVFIRSLGGNPEDSDSLKDTLTKVYLDQLYVVRDYRLKLVSDGHRSADHFLIPGGAEFIRELQARGAQV